MFFSLHFAMHYPTELLNSFFGSVREMDGHTHFQFEGESSLFSEGSTPEQDALILTRDQHTLRSINSTSALEGSNMMLFQKPVFMFKDAAPDSEQQLLTGEDQCLFKPGEKNTFSLQLSFTSRSRSSRR